MLRAGAGGTGKISFADGAGLDAFGRLRVSNPQGLFDSQFTYNLQPLLYEQITAQSGATIAHDATNRNALMTFASTPTGGSAYMQTFEYFRYQPGKSQLPVMTFNFIEATANCLKFVRYGDSNNGFSFENNGTTNRFVIYSDTGVGDQIANQADWNVDKLDGTGTSGVTLNIAMAQIFFVDLQALYTGRVRFGFEIDGRSIICHESKNANNTSLPYIQTANLPIRAGMTCTGTVSTTMRFTCATVISEGGSDKTIGFEFAQEGTVTAASGAATHLLSIRPKTTFNGIENRVSLAFIEVNILVTGTNPVRWDLVIGQAISGTTTFNDVNTTYSSTEYNTAGTISGAPAIILDSGYVDSSGAGSKANGAGQMTLTSRYPVTLDAAGAVRALGTLSLNVTGIGGTSACRGSIKYIEVR